MSLQGLGDRRYVVSLRDGRVDFVRKIDRRLVSYNIEMAEITGGMFWKKYTLEQIASAQPFAPIQQVQGNITQMTDLMQYYPPIDLYSSRLRYLAKQLGPAWVRVSGTWATKTYYDFSNQPCTTPPKGYQNVLTKAQWIGVLDFVRYIDAKLLISVSNCQGDHPNGGALNLKQAEKIFKLSADYGVEIAAVEFMNEPNMLQLSGAPEGYTPKDYARDQDILFGWVRENYPKCLLVGPCTTGDPQIFVGEKSMGAGIGNLVDACTTQQLLEGTKIKLNAFSYHYYNGVSERLAGTVPTSHWSLEEAHTDRYLAVAGNCAAAHAPLRDRFAPDCPMWVTESGDAGGGGSTWASTYLDVFRTLNEFGSFAQVSNGVIFHNTLASSDYGYLSHEDFLPRPNYFAALLWKRLMGDTVFCSSCTGLSGAHIYCHTRADGKPGVAYLIINNDLMDELIVEIPKSADRYTLTAATMRATTMQLNGYELKLDNNDRLPTVTPMKQRSGKVVLPPGSCTFLIM